MSYEAEPRHASQQRARSRFQFRRIGPCRRRQRPPWPRPAVAATISPGGAPRSSLLGASLHLLDIGVDRVDDLGVRMGFAIDDDLVDALFGAGDVDRVPLHVAIPPA